MVAEHSNSQVGRRRNKLLRRVDWRFLLPNPSPQKSVCFANGLLAEAVAAISESTTEARLMPSADCDLAVAVDPCPTTLGAAWGALQPGGSCYTEWRSPLTGGPQGAQRRLESAGFEDVRCYWPWPWPGRASAAFWLPLASPGALSYFQSSRPMTAPIWRRAIHGARWLLWRAALRARLMVPVCAVARKPVDTGSDDLPVAILDQIRTGWTQWESDPPPDRLSWLLLTGGFRSINKVVGLVFADSERRPRLIVKMPRVPDSLPALAKEAATLRAIHARRPSGVPGVPRVLFFEEYAGLPVLGETALTGLPLWSILRRDNYRELALKATDWLADLAEHQQPQPRAVWWERLVEPALKDFEQSFGPVVDAGSLGETRSILARLGHLPLVCEQRDFSPWNVLVAADGGLVVLDWESAEWRGLPALDLIYFLTYLALFVEGIPVHGDADLEQVRRAHRASMNPTTFTGSVLRECLARYANRIGLDPAALYPLGLLAWLIHSRSEYKHFTADVGGRPGPGVLRRSLFVGLWEEELRYGVRGS